MLRYLRRLADADLALDRTMIPLGSCTMKLNATTEMEPVTWPGFADLHPFAAPDDTAGYRRLIDDLERWLCEITGYDAVSLQPNAGSQGEFAGLLAIRAWHHSRGDADRDVCLIPASAHGTNAASAAMVGMRVVVVACDDDGNVDLDDLSAKLESHRREVAALMVTYPSTHGVFEEAIGDICAAVHDAGGQVYLDGANLNALVGVARPGRFGADVSHLNLHKTFCIPHGGGGPGVGPVAVRAHLAPFLPSHPVVPAAGPPVPVVGAVSAAPWGSAGILPIPWAYIALMGPDGLRRATAVAILSANYIAHRLGQAYPILYSGRDGLVAHECILDLRPITRDTGVTVDDVAKRLIDYGFHAPTMSFPVAGTLMVETTESEGQAELDRFCDAMLAIRAEIDAVAAGTWPADDNPLGNAPHPAADVAADEWTHPTPAASPGGRAAPPIASASTGRRSAASTAPTATATSCARAHRSTPSPTGEPDKPSGPGEAASVVSAPLSERAEDPAALGPPTRTGGGARPVAALRRHVLPGRGRRADLPAAGRAPGRPRPAHVGPRRHRGALLRRCDHRPAALRSPRRSGPGPHPVARRRGPQPREPRLVRLRHRAVAVRCRPRPVGAGRGHVPPGGAGQPGARRSGPHRPAAGSLRRHRDRWLHVRAGHGDGHLPAVRPEGAVPGRGRGDGRRAGRAGPRRDPGDPDRSRTRPPRGALRRARLADPFRLLRHRGVVVAVLLQLAVFLPVGIYDSLWARYLTDRGATTLLIGFGLTLYGLPFVLAAPRGGRLADRLGPVRSTTIGMLIVVPATAIYGLLAAPLVITAIALLEAVGNATAVPGAQTAMARSCPRERLTAGQGLSGAVSMLGAGFAAVVAAPIYEAVGADGSSAEPRRLMGARRGRRRGSTGGVAARRAPPVRDRRTGGPGVGPPPRRRDPGRPPGAPSTGRPISAGVRSPVDRTTRLSASRRRRRSTKGSATTRAGRSEPRRRS